MMVVHSKVRPKLWLDLVNMMADGHGDRRRSKTNYVHNLARLVESKYGKVIEVPQVLKQSQ